MQTTNGLRFETRIFKGSPNHAVIDADGREVATAHCANVTRQIFTVVIDGKFSGLGTEAQAVAKLKSLIG